MIAESKFAASAYQNLAKLKEGMDQQRSQMPGKMLGADETSDFGGMVTSVVSQFSQQARAADQTTAAMASGKTDLVDVVTAVSETQVAMETLVSVRDQIISAYEKIMQMPI